MPNLIVSVEDNIVFSHIYPPTGDPQRFGFELDELEEIVKAVRERQAADVK